MSRKTGDGCTFKQRDVRAAIKAARDAGLQHFRVDIDKQGTISVVPTVPGEAVPDKQPRTNEWDDDL